MKKTIILLMLLLSTSLHAKEPTIHCANAETEVIASDSDEIDAVVNKDSDSDIEKVSLEICSSLTLFKKTENRGKLGDILLHDIMRAQGYNEKNMPRNYKEKFTTFWNKHHNSFICDDTSIQQHNYTRPKQHYLKKVIEHNLDNEVFRSFLLSDPKGLPINVNSVEIQDGKPETVIDFLDKLIADKDKFPDKFNYGKIRGLKRQLIRFYGAKTAKELGCSIQ